MTNWIAFTAYTPEYEDEFLQLKETADKFDIPLVAYPYESTGDWMRNCAKTVEITLKAMEELWPRPIVWIDADARFMQFPHLFNDLAFAADKAVISLGLHKRCNKSGDGFHYNSGTIFIANHQQVQAFFREQLKLLQDYQTTRAGTYPYMDWMVKNWNKQLDIYELPLEYSYIEGTEQPEEQIPFGRVVILHTQASRRKRKEIRDAGNL